MNEMNIEPGLDKLRYESYRYYGAHIIEKDGRKGVVFRVFAPNAKSVSVTGDFNEWQPDAGLMSRLEDRHGVWELFIPDLEQGMLYKYTVHQHDGALAYKADPYAFYSEVKPKTASIIWDVDGYTW